MDKTLKTVVFISNFFNHHQKPFSEEMYARLGDGYTFIATEPMDEEREQLGWGMETLPDYVVDSETFQREREYYRELLYRADVVIVGAASDANVKHRIAASRLTLRYSERPLKKGFEPLKYPIRLFRWHRANPWNKNIYMLCASAYTAGDYAKFGLFRNRCYKWGYFPATKEYDIEQLISSKKPASLLWCARLIDWKHPEVPVEVAKRLKADGYSFTLNMIGNGVMEEQIKKQIADEGLEDCVYMLGAMKPEQVREHMEQSEIFLFTSDRNEGWGAVLNESMNSGCAVVASHAIGAVPFLLKDGENGEIYRSGDVDMLYEKVKQMLEHPERRRAQGIAAYQTITQLWNAQAAVQRLLKLLEQMLCGDHRRTFVEGPCSAAQRISEIW